MANQWNRSGSSREETGSIYFTGEIRGISGMKPGSSQVEKRFRNMNPFLEKGKEKDDESSNTDGTPYTGSGSEVVERRTGDSNRKVHPGSRPKRP